MTSKIQFMTLFIHVYGIRKQFLTVAQLSVAIQYHQGTDDPSLQSQFCQQQNFGGHYLPMNLCKCTSYVLVRIYECAHLKTLFHNNILKMDNE